MKELPYFKWYPADAETDQNFRAMDDSDIGFYIRCLNHAWINKGIPADPKERARVLRTRLDTANKRWDRVGKCFVNSSLYPERLINLRQETERSLASQKSQMAAESVKVRYERKSNVAPRALAQYSETETYTEAEKKHTHTNGRVRVTDLNGQTSQRFDEFWDRYPRQQHRDAACQQWLSVVTIEVEPALFACLQRYLGSDEVARGAVANPEKWLHEQHRDSWAGNWPPARLTAPQRRESVTEQAIRMAKERQNGTH